MTEIVELRTRTCKVFERPGLRQFRTEATIASAKHVPDNINNYQNQRSFQWLDIDKRLQERANRVEVVREWYDVEMPMAGIGYTYTSKMQSGAVQVELLELNGTPLGIIPAPRIIENECWWIDVVPGLDVYVRTDTGRVDIYKKLKNASAPREFLWRVTEFGTPPTLKIETAGHDNADRNDPNRVGVGLGRHRRQIIMADPIVTPVGNRSYTVLERWTGQTVALDANRVRSPSNEVSYPVLIDQDISEGITDTTDDGHYDGQSMSSTNTFQTEYGTTGDHIMYQDVGYDSGFFPVWRFQTIAIDQGVTIDAGTQLVLTLNGGGADTEPTATVYGRDVDDAPAWTANNGPPSWAGNGERTTASAAFGTWGGESGTRNINIVSIVQELVDRAGWATGQDMAFGAWFDATGGSVYPYQYIGDSNRGAATDNADLEINFTGGGGGANPKGVLGGLALGGPLGGPFG